MALSDCWHCQVDTVNTYSLTKFVFQSAQKGCLIIRFHHAKHFWTTSFEHAFCDPVQSREDAGFTSG